jgi:hypothetical protein
MMPFLTPMLAAMLLTQTAADRTVNGEVVDDQGKPVANAEVFLHLPPTSYGTGDSAELRATSDAQGKFSVPLERPIAGDIFAYQPGLAITARWSLRPPYRLVLTKPSPRTVKVEGPDGRPIPGARVALKLVRVFGGGGRPRSEVPPSLADRLAVRTGPDGTATITGIAPRDQLVAVRVMADTIGTQDVLLIKQPGPASEESVITIKLKPITHLAGRIVDQDGQPVAGQLVEIWSRREAPPRVPAPVEFTSGPLRSAADGSFQTPDDLMAGSNYQVTVRAPGHEPVLSDWITIGEKRRTLPLLVLRPLGTVRGRVVDRQGKPVANVEVFQSGDGPEQTTTQTDADGRFSLAGFRQGPVFVFVRGADFRFQGQLVKAMQRNVTVELTRTSERPAREMKMMTDPIIPPGESRALARRLVEPLWEQAAKQGPDSARFNDLVQFANVDPARLLGMLESMKFDFTAKSRLQRQIVLALARTDFEEATAVAESIADLAWRAEALVRLADRVPAADRDRKLALLARALPYARTAADQPHRLLEMGEVAERWYTLGEVAKAKALFAEGLEIASRLTDKTDPRRGAFAARLARVDPPAALAIAKDFKGGRIQARTLCGIAFRLIDQNPAAAERVWNQTKGNPGAIAMHQILCWKMATVDPARARRAIESLGMTQFKPELDFLLALGSKTRDASISRQAFQAGLDGIDRQFREHSQRYQFDVVQLLPIVERIDPGLVPELFWRVVSSRLPTGDPRTLQNGSLASLILYLPWYDREVAAALFEPVRARTSEASDADGASLRYEHEFFAWSLFDPRAAVARLETLPIDPKLPNNAVRARLVVASSLSVDCEERWRKRWSDWDIIFGGMGADGDF